MDLNTIGLAAVDMSLLETHTVWSSALLVAVHQKYIMLQYSE